MSKQATKALIDANITANGTQAITGPILNNVLNTMVDDYGTQEELSQLGQEVTKFAGAFEPTGNIIELQDSAYSVNSTSVKTFLYGWMQITGTASANGGRTTRLCTPFTLPAGSYRLVFSSTPVVEIFVEKVSEDTIIAQKSSPTFTLDAETSVYIGVNVVRGRTYNDDFGIAIFADQTQTEYKPILTAEDWIARADTERIDEYLNPSFSGQGTTYSHGVTTFPARAGATYRIYPIIKEWSVSSVAANSNVLGLGYKTSGASPTYIVSVKKEDYGKDYYDVTMPSTLADNSLLAIGGRADSGVMVKFTIQDISTLISVIEDEGKNVQLYKYGSLQALGVNTNVFGYFKLNGSANGGGRYRVTLKNWTKTKLTNELKFQLGYFPNENNLDTSTFVVLYQVNNTTSSDVDMSQYAFDFEFPENALLRMTIRGDEGEEAEYKIENVSYEDAKSGQECFYSGESIRVYGKLNEYKENIIIPVSSIAEYNGKSLQGFAIYGKYAFITYDTGYIKVLDLDTTEIISSYAMPEGVQNPKNHAGMANFGAFYNDSDDFPLLYVSSYLENCCYVLRVTLSGCSLVQKVTMADAWHFLVDDDGNMIVHKNDWSTYQIFDIPDINDSEVVLNASDAKDSFSFETQGMQTTGTFCQNNKMYVLCYYTTAPASGAYDRLSVFDYKRKEEVSRIVFQNSNIRKREFEGMSPTSDGNIMISFDYNQLAEIIL